MTIQEAYQILGLDGHPTAEHVKQAYRRRALEWHPDRFKSQTDKHRFGKRFMEARAAYDLLRNEGFPELLKEPIPEPDFSPRVAGRRFTPQKPPTAPLSETLDIHHSLNAGSALFWAVILALAAAGLSWMLRLLWTRPQSG